MRLAITRSFMMLSMALMAIGPLGSKRGLSVAVSRNEQLFDRDFLRNEVLLLHVTDQRFQRRAILLDAVQPGIVAEHIADLVELSRQERHHVAQRARGEH